MPAVSRAQFRYFKFLEAHPAEARARRVSQRVIGEFTANPTKGLPDFIQKKKIRK